MGPRRDFLVDDLMQQIRSQVILSDLGRRFLMEIGEFTDLANVSLDGSLGLPGQLQVFDHFVEPFSFEMLRGLG